MRTSILQQTSERSTIFRNTCSEICRSRPFKSPASFLDLTSLHFDLFEYVNKEASDNLCSGGTDSKQTVLLPVKGVPADMLLGVRKSCKAAFMLLKKDIKDISTARSSKQRLDVA